MIIILKCFFCIAQHNTRGYSKQITKFVHAFDSHDSIHTEKSKEYRRNHCILITERDPAGKTSCVYCIYYWLHNASFQLLLSYTQYKIKSPLYKGDCYVLEKRSKSGQILRTSNYQARIDLFGTISQFSRKRIFLLFCLSHFYSQYCCAYSLVSIVMHCL